MEKIKVALKPPAAYEIFFGDGIWQKVRNLAAEYERVFLITDENVQKHYGERLLFPRFILNPGESEKTWPKAYALLEEMSRQNLDRASLVVALGGGVVGDLAGFAASIFMRGIDYIQIPTTLLAQVDSAVGGKTAVNTPWGKNLVGTFHHPRAVFIDPAVLKTLSLREIRNGLGEVLKYGVIADPSLFFHVLENLEGIFFSDPQVVGPIIRRCLEIKSEIVVQDKRDLGLRKILNFGHTMGHALEAAANFKGSHGEAVLIGMLYESRLAADLGILPLEEYGKIAKGLRQIDLNLDISKLSAGKISKALLQDKKNRAGQIAFILPEKMGQMKEIHLELKEVLKWWQEKVQEKFLQ